VSSIPPCAAPLESAAPPSTRGSPASLPTSTGSKSQGVSVERFNLSKQPAAFAEDAAVKAALEAKGEAALPLVNVNGDVKSVGTYPVAR
jgi:hypothetical protein